ncbi:hypothetical protein FIBSPDRAFT_905217 [Athelia psychrophila]|uniref:Uncharacterized protein n=1 Tax=Athelia psychrophila TaxID=1759441 RepID=A0A167TQF0_9AGAM|nr:hypothetical protein FIBSPDRAFT_905217 [Fibularhizoctonia sp. CBS 109695]
MGNPTVVWSDAWRVFESASSVICSRDPVTYCVGVRPLLNEPPDFAVAGHGHQQYDYAAYVTEGRFCKFPMRTSPFWSSRPVTSLWNHTIHGISTRVTELAPSQLSREFQSVTLDRATSSRWQVEIQSSKYELKRSSRGPGRGLLVFLSESFSSTIYRTRRTPTWGVCPSGWGDEGYSVRRWRTEVLAAASRLGRSLAPRCRVRLERVVREVHPRAVPLLAAPERLVPVEPLVLLAQVHDVPLRHAALEAALPPPLPPLLAEPAPHPALVPPPVPRPLPRVQLLLRRRREEVLPLLLPPLRLARPLQLALLQALKPPAPQLLQLPVKHAKRLQQVTRNTQSYQSKVMFLLLPSPAWLLGLQLPELLPAVRDLAPGGDQTRFCYST